MWLPVCTFFHIAFKTWTAVSNIKLCRETQDINAQMPVYLQRRSWAHTVWKERLVHHTGPERLQTAAASQTQTPAPPDQHTDRFTQLETGTVCDWQLPQPITHLDHEVVTEAPAGLSAFLSERPHLVLEAAQIPGEGHEQQRAQFSEERTPRLLRARRLLQRVRQSHTPDRQTDWTTADETYTKHWRKINQRLFSHHLVHWMIKHRGNRLSYQPSR